MFYFYIEHIHDMPLAGFRNIGVLFIAIQLLLSCSKPPDVTLKPEGYDQENGITIKSGKLQVTFVDNNAYGNSHRAGYNGIAELYYDGDDSTIFVPFYAGFNLEHIFGGDSLPELFEPRKYPMVLYRKSENEVLLYQEPTPLSGVESLTEFRVIAPNYIDITFTCVLHNLDFFSHDYAGLFWASYIHQPEDQKIYFMGSQPNNVDTSWIEAYSTKHGVKSTHRQYKDDHTFYFADNFNATLASHFSEYRYQIPFYFGKFHNRVLAFLFDADEIIRFSQSPTGGGEFNPAWDFQYLIPGPVTGKKYTFNSRLIYKPISSNEDILSEYQQWINQKNVP